jgi:hypothetical protein
VILGLVGVDNESIALDYNLSSIAMERMREWLDREFPERRDAMTDQPRQYFECPPEAMLGFLDRVSETWGSMVELAHDLGVDDDVIEALRELLVEEVEEAA